MRIPCQRLCAWLATLSGLASGGCESGPAQDAVAETPLLTAVQPASAPLESRLVPTQAVVDQAVVTPKTSPPPQPPLPPLAAGQMRAVPTGHVLLGSAPGTPGRNPALEADLLAHAVDTFEIDRLPYPNDPAQPPLTGLNRAQAESKCAEHGKRLCTELEWERACKGDTARTYATGAELPMAQCRALDACQSPLGVASMGSALREWTGSDEAGGIGHPMRTAAVRGAGPAEPLAARRCGARAGATPESSAEDLGFRCCRSPLPPAKAPYPVEPKRPLVYELGADDAAVREVLREVPELAAMADDFRRFDRAEISAALRRGGRSRGSVTAWHITGGAFRWSPVRGEEFWVLSGRSGDRTLLALLYVLPEGRFGHAGSTIIDEPDATIALGYTDDKPTQLLWTTCFGCPGESGDIFYADDATLQFVHR